MVRLRLRGNVRRHARQTLLPCENDQAKPDSFSRLARSTNLSKILASIRLSGLVGSRPRLLRRGVLELVAHNGMCICMHTSSFLREPFKHIEVRFLCQPRSPVERGGTWKVTRCARYQRTTSKACSKRQEILEPLGFTGELAPGSCNGLFSLGIPYRGSRVRRGVLSPDPTN